MPGACRQRCKNHPVPPTELSRTVHPQQAEHPDAHPLKVLPGAGGVNGVDTAAIPGSATTAIPAAGTTETDRGTRPHNPRGHIHMNGTEGVMTRRHVAKGGATMVGKQVLLGAALALALVGANGVAASAGSGAAQVAGIGTVDVGQEVCDRGVAAEVFPPIVMTGGLDG